MPRRRRDDERSYEGEGIIAQLMETPQFERIMDSVADLADKFIENLEPKAKPLRHTAATARTPQRNPSQLARAIMNFSATEPLTTQMIKDRKKALAQYFHPDKGGSLEAMQRLNRAADCLLASLARKT